jgi:hypothetical protein
MVPDFALRLQAMIRSLREVILPALPAGEALAIDQANILVGYLRIMASQHDKVFDYLLAELSDYAQLVDAMVEDAAGETAERGGAVAHGGVVQRDGAVEDDPHGGRDIQVRAAARDALARAMPILAMSVPRQAELCDVLKSLKQCADDLLHAAQQSAAADRGKKAAHRVMELADRQITRERAWFRASGFELDADKVPSIDEVLYARRDGTERGPF